MKIVVCVKYVPVVARIQFDYENKTIIREGVPSEVNPFDMLGLVRAVELKSAPDDQVVVLCMGPPQARDGLLECLALGADRAILLTDRALAGSDTLATARALSLALKKEAPDLIICGRNSADSETGQVGPETAELMDIPHVGQVSKLDLNADSNTIVTERLTDEGYQVIECPLPALVCVTEGVAEETFPNREQLAEAETKPLQEVTCAQLSPDSSQFGAEGSPTWVEEIRLVEPNRSGVIIEEEDPQVAAEQAASLLKERLAELDSADNGSQTAQPTERFPSSRDKSIWVIAESWPADLAHVTLELLGKARELTSFTRSEVAAVLIGPAQPDLNGQLAAYGADRVLVLDNTGKGPVWGRQVVQSLAAAVHQAQPYAVLFASTPDGRDLASRVAARLALGLTGDAIDLEIDEEGRLVQLKPALGGNVVAPILSKTLPNMVTLRPGLLTPVAPVVSSQAPVEAIAAASFDGPDVTVLEEHVQEDIGALELTQAQVVLGVGMGIGGPENLPQIQKLAHSINASLATTRNVTHEGWLPVQIQVGISGRSITPKVYLAVGIRGAFNHTVGIQKAGVILALNQNRRHAIFKSADFGIVGDWNEFLPPLIEALKPVLAELG
ncbi:MAG: FAD-binding protein [Chloroflexota bacterium]|nr:FAD-binding protein [Chloroflexota bacterium]|tara:strand:- start:3831 stop:5672 length:1842 start_codon:yes stop_codon:yes gene_type:complete